MEVANPAVDGRRTLERWSREPSSAASRNVEQASAQDLLDVHSQQEQEVPSNAREPDPRPATGVRVQRRRRVRGRYPRRVKYTDASVQELKGKQQLQGPGKEDLEVEPDSLGQLPDDEALSRLLSELDRVVLAKASIDKIYGHIYNHGNLAQPRAYLRTLRQYTGPASRICEIGFAGGHSATIFLHGLPQAEYQAFDMWDRPFYEDAALAKVRSMFPGRNITVTKGDSTVTVPKYKVCLHRPPHVGPDRSSEPCTHLLLSALIGKETCINSSDPCANRP